MGIFKPFRSGETIDIENKFKEIRKDLLDNAEEIRYRTEYYTRKYRGNRLNDINVGIITEPNYAYTVQVFLRNKQGYIKNNMLFDYKGRMINEELKIEVDE